MVLSAVAVLRLRQLFAVIMLAGAYSLATATLYVVLDAVDVAFTEAVVGAGIATVLMLAALATLPRNEKKHALSTSGMVGLVAVILTGGLLVYGSLDMPAYGDPNAPIHHHVVPRYLEKTLTEVGMPNVVTSVLASYRGYDTLGETHVIFTAAIGVMVLIGRRARAARRNGKDGAPGMKERPVLRVGVKLLIPFILLFALYVQFHGDFGPGGGFQAGVIFAAAFIVYTLIYGVGAAKAMLPALVRRLILCGGVLLYAGVGVFGPLLGRNYLDYGVLSHDPVHGQELGVALVEFGVGMAVFAAMSSIFIIFADYSAARREDL